MSAAPGLIAAMAEAMALEAAKAARAQTHLVSLAVDMLDAAATDAAPKVEIVRKTRTLVFSSGEAVSPDGRRAMAATAVHRIVG
ncbi:MAG: hypothetical protein NW203_07320 [Hyphomonadaceae bacterium]|nr:hypothetical protein [Hyphomonadaceae bacterium]